ncbi:hypothetical protein QFZ70_002683 [Arthrobacter sp. V1I9]|uniref:hypothetical protein n=1 Tax=Arthrobacter sp. V1I9 TaxID=3042275 RepID=UPI002792DE60|nr:hypothetical protein [Arthrobacter sp. V1I9]MDQ0870210.1 hypothetical protein [Arthrobacter sp. V1I9]
MQPAALMDSFERTRGAIVPGEVTPGWRARQYRQPVLLEKPDHEKGLTEVHVVAVQVFINDEDCAP